YKMGEWYYDPAAGRFTQEDPLGSGRGYAGDNPVNFTDPSGLFEDENVVVFGPSPPSQAGGGQAAASASFNPLEGAETVGVAKLEEKGFLRVGENAESGKGAYVNLRTGRSYHIDHRRHKHHLHVDVKYRKQYRKQMRKLTGVDRRRFFT
ncbi:MAG: RHS repeat-associated core domain-containing protein, partial [Terriglobia bacterium]